MDLSTFAPALAPGAEFGPRHAALARSVQQRLAWFQGRSEFGPRALGHRSLLADPRNHANLEKLNDIKGREQFRPVAPMVPRRAGG